MTRTFTIYSVLGICVGLLLFNEGHPSSSITHHDYMPMLRHGSGKAANWAGYVAAPGLSVPVKHSVTDVQGSWRVPTVTSSGTLDSSSAIWVGIDGDLDKTVEQIGTEQDWNSGTPVYFAWFEMYPARAFLITAVPIQPGDEISAEVQFLLKNKFVLSISNLTQNTGFSITRKRAAQRTSAEWIVEAPFFRRILSLADFGSVTFTGCSANMEGNLGPIDGSFWQNEALTMENPLTSTILAQPGGLTSGGTVFTVDWDHH